MNDDDLIRRGDALKVCRCNLTANEIRALPAAPAEDVRAGALAEARGKLHDLMCLPDGADLAIAKRWAAEARALIPEAKT